MSRLPVPGSDDNTWGDVLNDYLGVAHNTDGTIKTGVVTTTQILDGTITTTDISASAGITKTQLASAVQTSLGLADTALQSVTPATSTVTGGVRLTGDLGGTATAPTTPTAVHLTGNETIAGTKTFTDSTTNVGNFGALKAGTTDTNHFYDLNAGLSPRSIGVNPLSSVTYHDLTAFSRFWGTPTFQVSADNTTYTTGTLEPGLFSQKDSNGYTIIDGTTNTSARWTWNSPNVAYSIARTWMIGFPYINSAPSRNISLDSSADGTTWTNRFTTTGYTNSASQLWFIATDWNADTYIRLTVTVTTAYPLAIGSIRAFTSRWGNQGGGREYSFPYAWDASGRMAIGSGSTPYSNGVLTLSGGGTTTAAGGMYFGTDTNLYRSAASSLKSDSKVIAGGGLQIGSSSTSGQVWTATDANGNGSWQTFSNGYGRSVQAISSSVTAGAAASTDYIYYWTGSTAYTLTMPTAVSNTDRYTLKNSSTIGQLVATTSAQTIEGGSSITINAGNSVDLISNGSGWLVI